MVQVKAAFFSVTSPVLLREKPHTSATARENLRDAPVIGRRGPSFPALPGEQSRVLPPNTSLQLITPDTVREQSSPVCP